MSQSGTDHAFRLKAECHTEAVSDKPPQRGQWMTAEVFRPEHAGTWRRTEVPVAVPEEMVLRDSFVWMYVS